jgi:hypothetical protein
VFSFFSFYNLTFREISRNIYSALSYLINIKHYKVCGIMIFLLLCWEYIVAFTKVLTMCQIVEFTPPLLFSILLPSHSRRFQQISFFHLHRCLGPYHPECANLVWYNDFFRQYLTIDCYKYCSINILVHLSF